MTHREGRNLPNVDLSMHLFYTANILKYTASQAKQIQIFIPYEIYSGQYRERETVNRLNNKIVMSP